MLLKNVKNVKYVELINKDKYANMYYKGEKHLSQLKCFLCRSLSPQNIEIKSYENKTEDSTLLVTFGEI